MSSSGGEEVGEGAYARIGYADVETLTRAELDGPGHETLGREGIAHVAGLERQLPCRRDTAVVTVAREERLGLGDERLGVLPVPVQRQMVHDNVGALPQILEAYGASDARGAARDDGCLADEEARRQRHRGPGVLRRQ